MYCLPGDRLMARIIYGTPPGGPLVVIERPHRADTTPLLLLIILSPAAAGLFFDTLLGTPPGGFTFLFVACAVPEQCHAIAVGRLAEIQLGIDVADPCAQRVFTN